ncbi:hypothetical protein BD311DRAFT_763334 [Dichomitus squalens]|uniref:Uncharacterized protein n=1 Tax=Dichomitus squalens TaxID=114155 RepID=A0A4Q9MJ83_9APHY|nr:hypothetical protein BD311DRAFT_763334 [Dichomitus squalens]
MDYLVYDHGYPESSDDFSSQSFDSSASSPMAYFGDASPDYWSSPNQGGIPLQMPDPQVQPYQSASYTPLPSAPLMERRRQSETMSTVPSPLTVITSSLSGWTRDDLVTSRMVPPADQGTARPPEMPKTMPDPSAPSPPFLSATEYGFNDSMDPSAPYLPLRGDLLAVPTLDAELDRTPRDASFHSSASPANDLATSTTMRHPYRDFPGALGLPSSGGFMAPLYGLDTAADFESYNIGLRQYGIYAPHEVYATPDEAVNPYLLSFNNFVEYI